jgi:hypothetical protein
MHVENAGGGMTMSYTKDYSLYATVKQFCNRQLKFWATSFEITLHVDFQRVNTTPPASPEKSKAFKPPTAIVDLFFGMNVILRGREDVSNVFIGFPRVIYVNSQ